MMGSRALIRWFVGLLLGLVTTAALRINFTFQHLSFSSEWELEAGNEGGGKPLWAILDFCYVIDNERVGKGKKDMVVWGKTTISLGLKI